MSKKKLLLNKIADHSKKLAELRKQIKEVELAEQLKVGEMALEMYRADKWDAAKLKTLVVEIVGEDGALDDESNLDNEKESSV